MVVYFTFAFGVALHSIIERSKKDENEKSKFYLFPYSFDCLGKKMFWNFILNANESFIAYALGKLFIRVTSHIKSHVHCRH